MRLSRRAVAPACLGARGARAVGFGVAGQGAGGGIGTCPRPLARRRGDPPGDPAGRAAPARLRGADDDGPVRQGPAAGASRCGRPRRRIDGDAYQHRGRRPVRAVRRDLITGRQLELRASTPGSFRAWREEIWDPEPLFAGGNSSSPTRGAGTKLTFDHTGFPRGAGAHLAIGWYEDYWDPLKAFLACDRPPA